MRKIIGLVLVGMLACGCGSKEKVSREENNNPGSPAEMKQAASADSSLEAQKQKARKMDTKSPRWYSVLRGYKFFAGAKQKNI